MVSLCIQDFSNSLQYDTENLGEKWWVNEALNEKIKLTKTA